MADSASFLDLISQFCSPAGSGMGIKEGIVFVSCVTLPLLSSVVAVWVVTVTCFSGCEEFVCFTFSLVNKRSCKVLRFGILGRLEGLESLSLFLSDRISVRISLPPSLTTFIRFIVPGFS